MFGKVYELNDAHSYSGSGHEYMLYTNRGCMLCGDKCKSVVGLPSIGGDFTITLMHTSP